MHRPAMKTLCLCACFLLFASAACFGADFGVVTIVDGNARVLRGANWSKLAEGARVQDGDVVEAAERAQVQVELGSGPIVNLAGPAELYAAAAGSREVKQPTAAEVYLPHGWLKLAAKAPGATLRVRSPAGTIAASGAIAVVHAEADTIEAFMESGSAKLSEPAKGGADGAARELKAGDFAIRGSDRPFATAGAAPRSFVAAMPRHFRDPLPTRAAQYQVARVQLVTERPISYAEAEPWLSSPYRRAFLKRLQPRLADPEFRAPVIAKLQAYPEWRDLVSPAEEQTKEKADTAVPKAADKPKVAEKTEKAEPAQKSEPKSMWFWPFGKK
jgi:hypothetical protein